jgi:hypothetical protein
MISTTKSVPQIHISHILIPLQKVLIIGNSASGTDLAAQIAPHCTPPLLISSRSPPTQFLPSTSTTETASLPEIAHFNTEERSIAFKNSHVEHDIDAIIFCTGYLYSFPFLTSLDPPLINLHGPNAGTRVQNLYQHIFYRPHPTLSFIALPQRIIPFPLSEAQASVIARYLSGRLSLPSDQKMKAWEDERLGRKRRDGVGSDGERKFHLLGYPEDAEYINFLHDWALQASPLRAHDSSSSGSNPGTEYKHVVEKMPPFWGEEEHWMRERTPLIKKAARELGARRRAEVKTLEELGFDFGAWKRKPEVLDQIEVGRGEV